MKKRRVARIYIESTVYEASTKNVCHHIIVKKCFIKRSQIIWKSMSWIDAMQKEFSFPSILQSDHIRTIIKARGLWHPNVTGKTFAVFRVDSRHHLMSLVSMLGEFLVQYYGFIFVRNPLLIHSFWNNMIIWTQEKFIFYSGNNFST